MNIKYILSLLSFFFCFSTILSAQTGNCVVFSTTGETFHLGIDNKFQNADANSNIKVTGIPEGDYWVTVLFHDTNKKAFKTNIRVLEDKETAYLIEEYKGTYKLAQHSSVPKNQVKTLNTSQSVMPYNKAGVEVKGLKSADELSADQVHTKTEITRVQGDRNDPTSKRMGQHSGSSSTTTTTNDPNSKRMGNYSSTSGTNPDGSSPEPDQPTQQPETGTFVECKYIQTTHADGTASIVEECVTTIKDIVERNGQKQIRTKTGTSHTPTDFNCLPLDKDKFIALKNTVQAAESDKRLALAENGVKGQCMTPGQIKAIGDLILSEVDRNTFAIAAKSTCADPKKFPYEITEPVAVEEKEVTEVSEVEKIIEEEKIVEEKIIEEHKTEAQLKAELKALKAKEKLAAKAAKEKAKAEKKAAKEKEKAEKKAAKEKAKAEKAAAKAKK